MKSEPPERPAGKASPAATTRERAKRLLKRFTGPEIDPGTLLNALAEPIFVVDKNGCVCYANLAAEQFLATSASALLGRALVEILPADSPIISLIAHVRAGGQSV